MSDHARAIVQDQPWLPLLGPLQRAWREMEIINGRNPDASIEEHLRETGAWPSAGGVRRVTSGVRRTRAKQATAHAQSPQT